MGRVRSAVSLAAAVALVAGWRGAAAEDQAPPDPAAEIAAATKEYERHLGFELRVSVRGPFVVRGDFEQADLDRVADVCARTLEHTRVVLGAEPAEILRPGAVRDGTGRYDATGRVEVFQFKREREYLAFLDKVLVRIRDETVDDRRLALMRRQRGFFVMTPRPIIAQHQGPGEVETVLAQAAHKTSHVLLLSWRNAGSWMPWWFLEGFAAWQEFGVLRESRVYCIEVDRPGAYAKAGTPEADEAAKARMEAAWKKRLRELVESGKARDLRVLARLPLNEIVLEDVIQSWGFVDWLARERKLRPFIVAYKEKREFDAACETSLGAPPAGVEQRWRAWVTAK